MATQKKYIAGCNYQMKRLGVIKSISLLVILFCCFFGCVLHRHSGVVREWAADFILVQWTALSCLALWCASFLWLLARGMYWFLVGLLVSSIAWLVQQKTAALTNALVLLFSVMLGMAAYFAFKTGGQKNGEHSFLDGLIWMLALTLLWPFDLANSYYRGSRWTGLWENPNTYGVLMGAGSALAIGLLGAKAESEKHGGKQLSNGNSGINSKISLDGNIPLHLRSLPRCETSSRRPYFGGRTCEQHLEVVSHLYRIAFNATQYSVRQFHVAIDASAATCGLAGNGTLYVRQSYGFDRNNHHEGNRQLWH